MAVSRLCSETSARQAESVGEELWTEDDEDPPSLGRRYGEASEDEHD